MEQSINTCINCGQQVLTKYCSACGQINPPKKLGFATLWFDFQSRIYGFDGMFPRTAVDLTLRPGKVALEYIRGNRVKYVGPVGLLFLMLTFYVLFIEILGINFFEMQTTNNPFAVQGSTRQQEFSRNIVEFIYNNLKWVALLTIPISAFWLWLFFRKSKYNFLEHSILLFYTNSYQQFYMLLNLFLFAITGNSIMFAMIFVFVPYHAYSCVGFYPQYARTSAFIRGLLVAILGVFSVSIVAIVIAFIYIFTHPEVFEMIRPIHNQ